MSRNHTRVTNASTIDLISIGITSNNIVVVLIRIHVKVRKISLSSFPDLRPIILQMVLARLRGKKLDKNVRRHFLQL